MAIPIVKQNVDHPAGAMPRYTQYVVLGGIAVLVLLATFWSGNKPQKTGPKASAAGPTPNQLQSFQKALERQRQETENQPRSGPTRVSQDLTATVAPGAPSVPDPVVELNRKRAAAAPFASNFVVHAEPKTRQETAPPDLTTQIIALGPQVAPTPVPAGTQEPQTNTDFKPTSAKAPSPDSPKESGRRLPPQEGDLFRLYEGTLVQATLANRLDGSFTGPVNCRVSAPVLSQDRSATLIPVGSRFLGKANKVEAENQTRLAVTFKRLILPNGYSVDLEAAPGLDDAGETGLKGKVDNHNLRKFGLSGAVGLLGGLALYGGLANPYTAGVANSTGSSATNVLNHALNAVPTITVPEGHPVNVYLPGDLLLPPYRP